MKSKFNVPANIGVNVYSFNEFIVLKTRCHIAELFSAVFTQSIKPEEIPSRLNDIFVELLSDLDSKSEILHVPDK